MTAGGALISVVGARPNFMKIAPICAAWSAAQTDRAHLLVHTGQHYDASMKVQFFEQLGIPEPDIDLGVGSGTHAMQTSAIMQRFEPVLDQHRPAAVLVVGDVNSTIACALTAVKKDIPVIHVEAGLRSGDRSMPEEINRVLTDQVSSRLYTTERAALDNLTREGIRPDAVCFVGNVMIDTLLTHSKQAPGIEALTLGTGVRADSSNGYGLVTLHRPANVDDPQVLRRLIDALCKVAQRLPLLFPVHPRTEARLRAQGLWDQAQAHLELLPPLGYLQMVGAMRDARLVLTDSGGIQEETTALGVPCLTLRDNTERPITVDQGTNTLVGRDPERILEAVAQALAGAGKAGRIPELWDGRAAQRILDDLLPWLEVHGA